MCDCMLKIKPSNDIKIEWDKAERIAKLANLQDQQKKVGGALTACLNDIQKVQELLRSTDLTSEEQTLQTLRDDHTPTTSIAKTLNITTEKCHQIFQSILDKKNTRAPLSSQLRKLREEKAVLTGRSERISQQIQEASGEGVIGQPPRPTSVPATSQRKVSFRDPLSD